MRESKHKVHMNNQAADVDEISIKMQCKFTIKNQYVEELTPEEIQKQEEEKKEKNSSHKLSNQKTVLSSVNCVCWNKSPEFTN